MAVALGCAECGSKAGVCSVWRVYLVPIALKVVVKGKLSVGRHILCGKQPNGQFTMHQPFLSLTVGLTRVVDEPAQGTLHTVNMYTSFMCCAMRALAGMLGQPALTCLGTSCAGAHQPWAILLVASKEQSSALSQIALIEFLAFDMHKLCQTGGCYPVYICHLSYNSLKT